jgi:hypothetical protein
MNICTLIQPFVAVMVGGLMLRSLKFAGVQVSTTLRVVTMGVDAGFDAAVTLDWLVAIAPTSKTTKVLGCAGERNHPSNFKSA